MALVAGLRIFIGSVAILVRSGVGPYAVAIKPPRTPQGNVCRDGEVIWEQTAGQANPFEDRAATALAVLGPVENGPLDRDAPITDLLPLCEVEPSEGRAMAVRDLLRDTSGLKNAVSAVLGWLPDDGDLPGQSQDDVVHAPALYPAGMTSDDFVFNPDIASDEGLGSRPAIHILSSLLPFVIDMRDFVQTRWGQLLWLNRRCVEATPPTGFIVSARDAALLADAATRGARCLGQTHWTGWYPPLNKTSC